MRVVHLELEPFRELVAQPEKKSVIKGPALVRNQIEPGGRESWNRYANRGIVIRVLIYGVAVRIPRRGNKGVVVCDRVRAIHEQGLGQTRFDKQFYSMRTAVPEFKYIALSELRLSGEIVL